ncbi:hypothetical protein [Chitinivorax sp. B]|nr:hypothetical protein [Chitinivorax sp. B]
MLCVLGIVLSGVLQTLLIAAGLGKLLQTIPALVVAVKVVGAVYLA